jgi:hypothetical protein
MSIWDKFQMEEKILAILDVRSYAPRHHFGRPFLTPYQIASAFKKRHPAAFREIGLPLGGDKTGQYNSLSQYIAHQLSCRIRDKKIPVEGRFLYRKGLQAIRYKDSIETFQTYDLSMFRLQ